MNDGLFAGLRVIDCASFIAAPAAATVLADFGADVIKIEPPGGDPYRQLHTAPGLPVCDEDYFWTLGGRSKRSLALDLKAEDGRAVLRRLVEGCDVFITNMPPQPRRRLGITYEALAPLNPRMIYASLSAYGEVGEEADKTGFDVTAYWARSGLMDTVRPHADAEPARSTPGLGDHPTAMSVYAGIVTALYRRDRTGRGGQVTVSLLANGLWSNGCLVQAKLSGAEMVTRPPRTKPANACANHYRCRDGRWFILPVANEERQWAGLAAAAGRPDLLDDPRYATTEQRAREAAALTAVFDEAFARLDWPELRDRFVAEDLNFGIVGRLDDIPDDPQMRVTGMLVPFADGGLTLDSPFAISGEPKRPPARAPGIGQHTDEVLREAGYDEGEIRRLRALNVLA